MRNLGLTTICIGLLLVACNEDYSEVHGDRSVPTTISVGTELSTTSRVHLDEELHSAWNEGDALSLFHFSDGNSLYRYMGEDGARYGCFVLESEGQATSSMEYAVTLYPYSDKYTLNNSERYIMAKYAATQHYAAGSFGRDASLMASVSRNEEHTLKHLCGWLVIELYGTATVKSIVVRGRNNEQLAGDVKFYYDDLSTKLLYTPPTDDDEQLGGTLINGDYKPRVTLDCGDGITLDSDTPTPFFIALPPQNYTKGIRAIITLGDDSTVELISSGGIVIERNHIKYMESVELI